MLRAIFVAALILAAISITDRTAAAEDAKPSCPSGSPSPDGSTITRAAQGQKSCTLIDAAGVRWQYRGDTLYQNSSRNFVATGRYAEFQINSGGKAFVQGWCGRIKAALWFVNGNDGFVPTISPTHLLSFKPFIDTSRHASFPTLYALMTSGQVRDGDAIAIKALPDQIPIWQVASRIGNNNLTLNFERGAVIGCTVDEGNAVIPVNNGVNGLTINGGEIAYGIDSSSGQYRGINIGRLKGFTLNEAYIHDNDFGLQSGGDNGQVTIRNVRFDHNGSGLNGSATHNIYLGWSGDNADTTNVTITGGYSRCTSHHGFQVKLRGPSGTIENYTAAAPSLAGYDDCSESAAVDLSCGGNYMLGGDRPGAGVVLELGPKADNNTVVRFAAEVEKTQNCPSSGWRSNKLVIQNCWIVSDYDEAALAVYNPRMLNVVVKNCKIVQGAQGPKARIALGPGVTDGGGNKYYASRTAAFGPGHDWPYLPPPP